MRFITLGKMMYLGSMVLNKLKICQNTNIDNEVADVTLENLI